MRKVKVLKKYGKYRKGEVAEVTNNVAFGLIDKGVAKLYRSPAHRMMRSKGRRYKTK